MKAIEWTGSVLRLLDQRLLPHDQVWIDCDRAEAVAKAIVDMVVRGAPAIAAAAAYGVTLEARSQTAASPAAFRQQVEAVMQQLEQTRPTAVNLKWALHRMKAVLQAFPADATAAAMAHALEQEANQIASEDVATNRAIGEVGAALFANPVNILTHCNTGSLATVGYGTALGVIRRLHELRRLRMVWVDETRPYLQGARLTAFELSAEQIPYRLITDNTAAYLMQQGAVDAVIVGADRIARNGDTANKIGTYGLAVLCQHHHIPFYVAAPLSTFDWSLASGQDIPIETRNAAEVTHLFGRALAPTGAEALHVAFDVTPHSLITAIITEAGVIEQPALASMQAFRRRVGEAEGKG
ncbi:S-methyl-5-thioribose-1-phosphate isomerase [Alicyclobacillus cycloheptanicus]|uniref:Methylthioribose-1-phosphate isomerase n=1 Tax=Alicyclobacillus cycloheptanicus TaxID=1457 RepID=A0ABT9XE47_9BACL|nr:S-methyl-5-thioribose-1-phosphate isomerase [Alicyclobacillus cycloheptanicus]MDQ0188576.1 methylthioribose-1-phosphate isomerase [Alicyclobacillus cycloheptanicus]WDM01257.1 S-methyl-5-thioribose-1-phosphate isomerase [Alicyclobacillus cycloheptanicus]